VVLEGVLRRPRRLLAPQRVDQAVDRHDLLRAREQQRQQRPLPRSAERDDLPVPDDLERPEDPELDAAPARSTCA
jgi:hypothetical protein